MKSISFSCWFLDVDNILSGKKTMFRRFAAPSSINGAPVSYCASVFRRHWSFSGSDGSHFVCPYRHGDELAVQMSGARIFDFFYDSGQEDVAFSFKHAFHYSPFWLDYRLTPPELCPLHVMIQSIAFTPLHSISSSEAVSEGMHCSDGFYWFDKAGNCPKFYSLLEAYKYYWNVSNLDGNWNDNPFCYLFSFSKVIKPISFIGIH